MINIIKKKSSMAFLMAVLMIMSMLTFIPSAALAADAPTLSSAATDHLSSTVVLTFNKAMADPTGKQSQFTVKLNGVAKTISSASLSSTTTKILLKLSAKLGSGTVTVSYTPGTVVAADGGVLGTITNQSVTNNYLSTLELVDYEPLAEETSYDTNGPVINYKLLNNVDYDNVNLAFYFTNGFFREFENNLNHPYVTLNTKNGETLTPVDLPNVVTVGIKEDGTLPLYTYTDGSQKGYMEITDWYFWQIQYRAPLGMSLKSQALSPSTTYVVKIDEGFKFNNGGTTANTYYFEFTTTAASSTKPSWNNGTIGVSDLKNTSLTLNWSPAQDNHGVTSYTIYQSGVQDPIATVSQDPDVCTYFDVIGLAANTQYTFTVEANDFAGNTSATDLTKTVTTLSSAPSTPPALTADTTNTIVGNPLDITYPTNDTWKNAITGIIVDHVPLASNQYTKTTSGVITIAAGAIGAGVHNVEVAATGYNDAAVSQTVTNPFPPALTADTSDNVLGNAAYLTFTDDSAWRAAITEVKVNGIALTSSQYAVNPGSICIYSANGVLTSAGNHSIVVSATDYENATATQNMTARSTAPALTADTTGNSAGASVDISFTDNSAWRSAITGVKLDGAALNTSQYTVTAGNLNIAAGVITTVGKHAVVVNATGYHDAVAIQTMTGSTSSYFTTTVGNIITVAGNGTQGYSGDTGAATSASMKWPMGTAMDRNGNLYIVDTNDHRVREVAATNHTQYGISMTAGNIYTIAGTGTAGFSGNGGAATSAQLNNPQDVSIDNAGNLYIADSGNNCVRKVDTTGKISTFAGVGGSSGSSGDSDLATKAKLNTPYDVDCDAAGNLYIADYYGHRIRSVAVTNHKQFGIDMVAGNIYTLAGTGTGGYSGDGGSAIAAQINNPRSVAVDSAGNFYIADSTNYRVRKVAASTGSISTIAGTGTAGTPTAGSSAVSSAIQSPQSVAVDNSGNIYLGFIYDYRLLKINTSGNFAVVAGTGTSGYSGDGGAATSAMVKQIRKVMVDNFGNLFLSDTDNYRIRYVRLQ